jgi:hypothetical protein
MFCPKRPRIKIVQVTHKLSSIATNEIQRLPNNFLDRWINEQSCKAPIVKSTFVESTYIKSTFVESTFVKSTFVKSTFVKSTFVKSTFVKSTFVKSTFVPVMDGSTPTEKVPVWCD